MSEWKERPEYTPVPHTAPVRGAARPEADAPAGAHAPGAADDADKGADFADEADGMHIFSAPEGQDAVRREAPAALSGAPVRAINEDDDGYDPYSDWHDQGSSAPLFERDPWE